MITAGLLHEWRASSGCVEPARHEQVVEVKSAAACRRLTGVFTALYCFEGWLVHTTECVVTEERFIVASRVYIKNHMYKMCNQTTYMYIIIGDGES